MNPTFKKSLKITSFVLLGIILTILLILVGYVIYLSCTYYRIEDNQTLEINNNQENIVELNTELKISTFNIGFGAYSHDFSFFMDSGEMSDGTKVSGSGSKAKNKETVLKNTNGAIDTIKNQNPDFMFFQEVDIKADRSHFVNQYEMINSSFDTYSSNIGMNFHSGFLFYPIFDPHGSVDAGIATLSKYNISSSIRRSFPIDEGFFNKFFDLDRCFVINRLPVKNSSKELVLINLHMSAYDEGGKIREEQLKMLNTVLEAERGNYVIVGGDFNHDLAGIEFESQQKVPGWVNKFPTSEVLEGYKLAYGTTNPTCRSTDIPYTENVNYTVIIDGYIVSDNIKVNNVENIDTNFEFSDHNPSIMKFELI